MILTATKVTTIKGQATTETIDNKECITCCYILNRIRKMNFFASLQYQYGRTEQICIEF